MKSEEFIEAVKEVVRSGAIDDVIANVKSPPGRRVSESERKRSEWYNQLSSDEKLKANSLIEDAVDEALFGILSVIDGVRAIESEENKGALVLSYIKEGNITVLNSPEDLALHDLYND